MKPAKLFRSVSEGNRRLTPTRLVAGALIAVTAYLLIAQFLSSATSTPNGDTNQNPDSLSVDAVGTRAFADLLRSYGVDVLRYRSNLREARFDPASTIVLLNSVNASYSDVMALRDFVDAGGYLLIGANTIDLDLISSGAPTATLGRHDRWTLSPKQSESHNQAVTVDTAREASWDSPGLGEIRVGESGDALVVRETKGRGHIDYLADTTLLNNQLITSGDNAAFSYALVDNGSRPVIFVERSDAAASGGEGFSAIPNKWKFAALLMFVAMALYAWHRGQRFGVPDQVERQLAPARSEYISAMTDLLATANDPAAAQRVLAEEAQRLLHSAELHETDVEALAAIHRCDADDLRALFSMPPFEADPIRAARAFAAIQSTTAALHVAGKDRS